ncbi:hypothetical protein [Desulforhopalus sp. 52FAK]
MSNYIGLFLERQPINTLGATPHSSIKKALSMPGIGISYLNDEGLVVFANALLGDSVSMTALYLGHCSVNAFLAILQNSLGKFLVNILYI